MLEGCTPWPQDVAARYRDDGHWRGESLVDLLDTAVTAYGSRTALVQDDVRITYTELGLRTRRTAAGFRARGIEAGDRVVVQLPNGPEFVIVCFALFRLGALPVFALPAHRSQEITHLCAQSGAVGYVFPRSHHGFDHTALARRVRDEVTGLKHLFMSGEGKPADGDMVPLAEVDADPVELPAPDPADVAFFLLSGGTTALPKLIPRTHDDYVYQTRAARAAGPVDGGDVYLAVLPVEFNFTWGCPGVVGTLAVGGTVVLAQDPTPERCFPLIEQEGVTFTSVVPSVLQLWLEAAEWHDADLGSLHFLQVGSAKLYPEVAARVEPAFGCRLQQVFGMAEGLLTFTRESDAAATVLTTQGRPVSPADEIRIVDEEGRELPAGGIGELLARGPYTLRGYYRAPEHNRRSFTDDGFYRSGDLARLTPEGNLVIEGRIKDVIIRGGDKVSAAEVEGHLLALSSVARAAVVPYPDEYLGERTCAFLVPVDRPPVLAEIKAALEQRGLAAYKLPDRVEIVAELPLTGLGKTDKKVLAAIARGERVPASTAFLPVAAAARAAVPDAG
ncbi:(2,3-dihydroxybenzoyl)adenylate synthase [Streptomyces sp. NPDC059818]|uniref:(2,3-dihydroxybenzoyl)adenylate synthase n=1 Tax=Streptomyces sp. NPDC059818 TaxID=3346962 RepID=UPI00365FF564